MPQTEERNLELTPRIVETRDRRHTHTVYFELDDIVNRFNNTLNSIKSQFDLEEQLELSGDAHHEDILRAQTVFLDSAFDFFMHEITKYGMTQIFQRLWQPTRRYNNFMIRLGDISDVLQNPEQENWFLDIVNDTYAEDTFMSSQSVIQQLNLIGISWKAVANRAFYEQGSTIPTADKFKFALNTLFQRRNQIAHQADYLHTTGTRINIARTDVEKYIEDIEKIVCAIYEQIQEKNNA